METEKEVVKLKRKSWRKKVIFLEKKKEKEKETAAKKYGKMKNSFQNLHGFESDFPNPQQIITNKMRSSGLYKHAIELGDVTSDLHNPFVVISFCSDKGKRI